MVMMISYKPNLPWQRVLEEPGVSEWVWGSQHRYGSVHIDILQQGQSGQGSMEEPQPWTPGWVIIPFQTNRGS